MKIPIHKNSNLGGWQTLCGKSLDQYTANPNRLTTSWKKVTCKSCKKRKNKLITLLKEMYNLFWQQNTEGRKLEADNDLYRRVDRKLREHNLW